MMDGGTPVPAWRIGLWGSANVLPQIRQMPSVELPAAGKCQTTSGKSQLDPFCGGSGTVYHSHRLAALSKDLVKKRFSIQGRLPLAMASHGFKTSVARHGYETQSLDGAEGGKERVDPALDVYLFREQRLCFHLRFSFSQ
ncbi:MAG: hypothetical protein AB1714_29305 [Acidobacteriota bacterium]